MDVNELNPGAIVWHKHNRCPVFVALVFHAQDPDRQHVECYRIIDGQHSDQPLKTHVDLLDEMPKNFTP